MAFPSPSQAGPPQRRPADAPVANEGTPGREGAHAMPYMPPEDPEGRDGTPVPPPDVDNSRVVEQRRNPDGSMSISIGGNGNRSDGESAPYQQGADGDMSDVHMLLNEND